MNAFINIEKQQLHPLNCLIRLVIQYRTGPGPGPVPVRIPVPLLFQLPQREDGTQAQGKLSVLENTSH